METREFKLFITEDEDSYSCEIESLPIIGNGTSPVEALQSLVRSIPDVYEYWAENLTVEHVKDVNSLPVYKNLTYMVTNFTDSENSAVFYGPVKND